MGDELQLTPADDEPFDLEHEPLDRPLHFGSDWGGDGTDLNRPVRAHVLAALRPNAAPYPPPVDALKQIGDPNKGGVAEARQVFDLGQEHLPDLLRMARDRNLYTADSDSDEVWAPLHAFYALKDLDVSAAVPELIPLFDLDDDRFATELPDLLGEVGAPALEPLRAYLADHTRWGFAQWHAADALEQIGKRHPELREQVVAILGDVLRDAEHYPESACTGAMDALIGLGAVEALPLIRHAFEVGQIDEMFRGPWGSVLDDLGVETDKDDPLLDESERRFEERRERFMPRKEREQLLEALSRLSGRDPQHLFDEESARPPQPAARVIQLAPPALASQPAPRDARKTAQDKARKHKNKRKMEAASRKANRRKRR